MSWGVTPNFRNYVRTIYGPLESCELQIMKPVLVTKLKLYIELHGINKLGCLQINHVKKVLRQTYHRIWYGRV